MTAISDTHRLVERWRAAGIPIEQAGKMVDALNAELGENVATKQDVVMLRSELALAVRDLKIWTGSIAAASVAIIAVLSKVL